MISLIAFEIPTCEMFNDRYMWDMISLIIVCYVTSH